MKTNKDNCPFYSLTRPAPTAKIRFDGPKGESKTQQQYQAETDVNTIVRKAIKTGEPPPFKPGGSYGDFSIVTDYQTALAMVNDAHEAFDNLPAKIRKRFDNDPGQLLAFLGDPKNYDEGVELGFYEGPKDKTTVPEGQVVTQTLKTNEASPTPRG